MVLEPYKKVFADAWRWWGEDQVPRLSAALTFYAMLSLAPILLLAVATAGFFLGEESVRANLVAQMKNSMGQAQGEFIESLLKTQNSATGVVATAFGMGVLIFGASGLFEQLRDSVNAIWGLKAPHSGLLTIVRGKALAIIAVIVGSCLMIGWLILDSRLLWLSKHTVEEAAPLWKSLSLIASWAFMSLVFAAAFKWLPEKRIAWRDCWFAAIVSALAFTIGKYVLSLYFALAAVSAAYGAAGAIVVILLWVYYSSQIFFYGVEMSNAWAFQLGSLKGQEHDSEQKISKSGQAAECDEGEASAKSKDDPPSPGPKKKPQARETSDANLPHDDPHIPAPSITDSLAGLSQSLGHLGQSFAELGKSVKGDKKTKP